MALAHSKVTLQGQISVPKKIRSRLGLSPGSVLEWGEDGDNIVVRRAGRYTSAAIHQAIFPKPPKPQPLSTLRDGIKKRMRARHALS